MARKSDLDLNFAIGLETKGATQSFMDWASKIKGEMNSAIADGIKLGTKRSINVQLNTQKLFNDLRAAHVRASALQEELTRENISDEFRNRIKMEGQIALTALKGLEDKWNLENKHWERRRKAEEDLVDRLGERSNKAGARFADSLGRGAQSFGEEMHGVFSDIQSKDVAGMAGVIGKLAKLNAAAALKAKDAAVGKEGTAGGKALGGIGNFLAKIGPGLVAFAAIAMGLAAVVKILIDADTQAKEFNKTLLDAGVAGASLGDAYGGVGEALDKVTGAFAGLGNNAFNQMWGTSAKDHLEIIGAYEGAGATMDEFKRGITGVADEQERYRKATEAALGYSKLLGISGKEMAETFSTYMEELGLSLSGVEKRFSAIVGVARESGFGVKRFFSMISQATSGMSLYNVRLEEAAGLLTSLGKTLGEKFGEDFFKNLTEGLRGESYTDSIKRNMLMGKDKSGRYIGANLGSKEARMSAGQLAKDLEGQDKFKAILETRGLAKGGQILDPDAFVKKLTTMNEGDREEMMYRLEKENAGLYRAVRHIAKAGVGDRGTLGAAVASSAELGPGLTLIAKMKAGFAVLQKPLDQISELDLPRMIAAESLTGVQAEERRNMIRVLEGFREKQTLTSRASERIKKASSPEEKDAMAREFNNVYGKDLGVFLDATGQMFKSDKFGKEDKIGGEIEDFITALTKEKEPTVPEDLMRARETAKATTDIAKRIEIGVEGLLSSINDTVKNIFWAMPGGGHKLDAAGKATQKRMVDKLSSEIEDLRKNRAPLQEAQKAAEVALKKAQDTGNTTKILDATDALTAATKAIEENEAEINKKGAVRGRVGRSGTEEELAASERGYSEANYRRIRATVMRGGPGVVNTDVGKKLAENLGVDWELIKERMLEEPGSEKWVDSQGRAFDDNRKKEKTEVWPGVAKGIGEEISDRLKEDNRQKLMGLLANNGMDPNSVGDVASALLTGGSSVDLPGLTKEGRKAIMGSGLLPQGALEMMAGQANDLVVSGGRMQRVDTRDDIMAFQRGGPISKAMGGGTVNNITLVGAGPRDLLAGLTNAMDAGVL